MIELNQALIYIFFYKLSSTEINVDEIGSQILKFFNKIHNFNFF